MPTASKVLSIFVCLLSIAWLVLASMATQRSRNWGSKVDQMDKTFLSLAGEPGAPGQVDQARDGLAKLKNDIAAEQANTEREITVLRDRISDVEALLAISREDLARLQLLVRDTEEQVKLAQQAVERHTKEREQTKTDLAEAQTELDDLKKTDAELRSRRDGLFRDFQATLAENKQLAQRIRDASPSSN